MAMYCANPTRSPASARSLVTCSWNSPKTMMHQLHAASGRMIQKSVVPVMRAITMIITVELTLYSTNRSGWVPSSSHRLYRS